MESIWWGTQRLVLVTVVALFTPAPRGAVAQAPTHLAPGSRVRVKPTDGARATWVRGEVLSADYDSLRLLAPGSADTVAFATGAIEHLERSLGRHTRTGKGARLGGVIGASAGLLLGIAASAEECSGVGCIDVGPGEILAATAILGGLGAGVGALIGAGSRGERWARVPPPWVTARVRRAPRHPALGLTVRF
jgi:hypothetical protein